MFEKQIYQNYNCARTYDIIRSLIKLNMEQERKEVLIIPRFDKITNNNQEHRSIEPRK